eukprot:13358587-Ditylum_brightwellii.AAC.1
MLNTILVIGALQPPATKIQAAAMPKLISPQSNAHLLMQSATASDSAISTMMALDFAPLYPFAMTSIPALKTPVMPALNLAATATLMVAQRKASFLKPGAALVETISMTFTQA